MHRDRSGEVIEQVPALGSPHDPRCRDGWLPETADERPVPCLVCRPNIGRQVEQRRRERHRGLASAATREAAMRTIRATLAASRQDAAAERPPAERQAS
jgi:hypothetical protein